MDNVKSITPNAPADFTPSLGNYKDLQPFRYWCHKVLPMVYDDSLSYYELLCKVVDYLNKAMEDIETLHGDVTNLREAYDELQSYVNSYFSTLDVQKEINNKLDELVDSGRLDILLNTLIPYVTPEMFGAIGDGINDDTDYVLRCFESGVSKNKIILLTKKYKITEQINISSKVYISGGGTITLSGSNGLVFSGNGRQSGCKISDITINNVEYGKIGIMLENFTNSVLENVTISNCNGTGLYLHGDNFESKINMINIKASNYTKNIGINCESTDVTFSRINGLNIETFIINNASGNFYDKCHAWLASEPFIPNSVFCDVKISACFSECVIDTYQTGFVVNAGSTSRFIGCNWINNTNYLNKLTSPYPPTFIKYISTPEPRSNIKLIGCWLEMPAKGTKNWFDENARIFNADVPCYIIGCNISNCDDNIIRNYFYFNDIDVGVPKSSFRLNIELPQIQVKGEFLKETQSGKVLLTLPEFIKPTYNVVSTGCCRAGNSNNFIPCYYYLNTSGILYVTYKSDIICNSFILDLSYDI